MSVTIKAVCREYKGDAKETPPVSQTIQMKLVGKKTVDMYTFEREGKKMRNIVTYPLFEPVQEKQASYKVRTFEVPQDTEADISELEIVGSIDGCAAVYTEFDGHEHGMIPHPKSDKLQMFTQPIWLNTGEIPFSRVRFNFYFPEDVKDFDIKLRVRPPTTVLEQYCLDSKYELPTSFTIDGGELIFNKVDSRKYVYPKDALPTNEIVPATN